MSQILEILKKIGIVQSAKYTLNIWKGKEILTGRGKKHVEEFVESERSIKWHLYLSHAKDVQIPSEA